MSWHYWYLLIVVGACFIVWPFEMLITSIFLGVVTIGASLLTDWIGRG